MLRVAVIVATSLLAASARADLSAGELMNKNFYASKITAFFADATIAMINKGGQERVRKISIWSKLKENGVDSKVIMRFTSPADIKQTAFLQLQNSSGDDDMWIYLPALNKTRRLVSNEKKDSFFGTDFSYGDILLPPPDRYRHRLLGTETYDSNQVYVIESLPNDDKTRDDFGYSRKLSWVDRQSYLERKVEYFDADNNLLKTQVISNAKMVEPDKHRWVALRREMITARTGHKTVYSFERFDVKRDMSDSTFITRALERD